MFRPGWLLCAFVLLSLPARIGARQSASADTITGIVSPLAPDLAIVTEISLDTPYLGQQFCIIYRLRAIRPPAAIDIDPQQYPGFWTEPVPLSAGSAAAPRPVKGRGGFDYLLRQLIAYPLLEGLQKIPPLSVKVKRAGSTPTKSEEWDVVGMSDAVNVNVMPLPPGPVTTAGSPFVGGLQAAWSSPGERPGELLLEIQGTANLAFFHPLNWLRAPEGARLRERLVANDNLAQTVDIEGRRQLSYLQRQRWVISVSGSRTGQQLPGFYLPVFDPYTREWKSVRVETVALPGEESFAGDPPAKPEDAPFTAPRRAAFPTVAVIVLGIILLAGLLSWGIWSRRRKLQQEGDAGTAVAALERKLRTSPRAFIDGAHKVLLRWASENQRGHNLGLEDGEIDRCWISVQRCRFNKEPLTSETCVGIMQAIQKLLLGDGSTSSAPPPRSRTDLIRQPKL